MPEREQDVIFDLIKLKGPLTGLEIKKEIDIDSLQIWKICNTSPRLKTKNLGRRYLRLDRHVEGYARLSPSILREFFTYSVVGLAEDTASLDLKCVEVTTRIREISRFKLELARQMVSEIMDEFCRNKPPQDPVCFIIAGDIVYDMAHDVLRPERSTGKLVKGSDIDLVAIVSDEFPDDSMNLLDQIIYQKKYRMLINPSINEEVDYKIKRLSLIKEQVRFDQFSHMVAMKILQEGVFIYGSDVLFHAVKAMIRKNGIVERLEEFERQANIFRLNAEKSILSGDIDGERVKEMYLFYSAEEFEEFE